MKELSLNILDIAQNSLTAKATLLKIILEENNDFLRITIADNGCGMDEQTVKNVVDPFYTTRKTRKVGLGIPFFKLASEQTGGSITLESTPESLDAENHGTTISGVFYKTSIDFTPLGDIISTVCTLVQSLDYTELVFTHSFPNGSVELDTAALKEVLGDVPLSTPDVLVWIKEYLSEQYEEVGKQ